MEGIHHAAFYCVHHILHTEKCRRSDPVSGCCDSCPKGGQGCSIMAGEMKNSVSWKSKTTNVGLWNKLGGWMFGWLLEDVPNMHSSSKANLCSSAIKSHAPFTIPTNHASRRYAQGLESRVDMDATHWPYLNGCSLIERYQASTFGRAEHVRQGENDPKLYMSNTIRSAVAGILRNI